MSVSDSLEEPSMPGHPALGAGPVGGTQALAEAAGGLVRERLRFALPTVAISLGAYVAIAVLTGFTDVLATPIAGVASLALLLLMLLVPLTWLIALAYRRRADRWDALAAEIRRSAQEARR